VQSISERNIIVKLDFAKAFDREENSYSLAAWSLVCKPKKKGGLVILDFKIQNQALLLKYLHKFFHKHDIPWVMLIWFRYYPNGVPQSKKPCGSFWWRDVASYFDLFRGITSYSVNAGDTVLLWKDIWAGETPLHDQLPHLFSFSSLEVHLSLTILRIAAHQVIFICLSQWKLLWS
jgi:hypothetical protein